MAQVLQNGPQKQHQIGFARALPPHNGITEAKSSIAPGVSFSNPFIQVSPFAHIEVELEFLIHFTLVCLALQRP
jgi:hypothetical protein